MTTNRELRSKITRDGLELSLVDSELPALQPDQVLVQVAAAPINPSDLWLLVGPADLSTATVRDHVMTAKIAPQHLAAVAARLDQSLATGVEGAGVVIEAGDRARELVGKCVAVAGGGLYARFRIAYARECLVLPPGITPAQGASAYVNPMTVVSMLETMRSEQHTAIVHTAAASNLGQMLVRACAKDDIPLVNVVRNRDQVAILRELGATHVLDSSSADFDGALLAAIAATDATLAFDAIGGGSMAGRILAAMETAQLRKMTTYNRYGSPTRKQVYIYGRLDVGKTEIDVNKLGFAYSIGGWLLTHFLQRSSAELVQRLRARVVGELTTTFASKYTATVSLEEALQPEHVQIYGRRATGSKYLIDPSR